MAQSELQTEAGSPRGWIQLQACFSNTSSQHNYISTRTLVVSYLNTHKKKKSKKNDISRKNLKKRRQKESQTVCTETSLKVLREKKHMMELLCKKENPTPQSFLQSKK